MQFIPDQYIYMWGNASLEHRKVERPVKKTICLVILFSTIVSLCATSFAEEHQGESRFEPSGTMYEEHQGDSRFLGFGNALGIVLCETLSLRESPNTAANVLATLPYGASIEVLDDSGQWFRVRCYGTNNVSYDGWVNGDYVIKNPSYYTTTQETPAYAYASSSAKRVGLIDAGVLLPIIAEVDGFYVVSLRAASAFIQK